jgi:Flp pilus assembly protein TadD
MARKKRIEPYLPSDRIRLLIVFAMASAGLFGCASSRNSPDTAAGNYQTIARDPHRDTDLARRETDLAIQLIDHTKWPEAHTALQKALDADVTYGPAHNNLGTVYMHENNLYLAAWEFQYAAKLMPYQPQPRSNLGLVLEAAGKLDEAVDWYDQAIKIEPDNPEFLGNSARARVRRGDKDAKVRDLLVKLAYVDTRPQWVQWARERLVLLGPATTEP